MQSYIGRFHGICDPGTVLSGPFNAFAVIDHGFKSFVDREAECFFVE
jgi:hypothetical protein